MSVAAAATTVPRREHVETASKADRHRIRTAFAFLAPSLLGVILFLVIPIIFVIGLSLVQWNMLTPMKWVGLSNYVNIFEFDGFGHSLVVTPYYVILNIPIQTVFALGMAMLLRSQRAGTGVIRIIAVLPFLSTPVAMGVVWNWILNPSTGLINQFLGDLGIAGPAWLSSEATAMPVIAFANIWQYAGYNMLFFLAA
jgi:ABC-type sugar transport system permease subunit